MRAALEINWVAVEQQAIQGVPWPDIARSVADDPSDSAKVERLCATIRKRASRERWPIPRTVRAEAIAKAVRTRNVTIVTPADRQAGIDASSDVIGRFRTEMPVLLTEAIRKSLVTVTDPDGPGLPPIRTWKDATAAINAGYKVAGLDAKGPGVQVNIAVGGASKLSSCGGMLGIQVQVGDSHAE